MFSLRSLLITTLIASATPVIAQQAEERPGGVAVTATTVTATVSDIDYKNRKVTLTGPDGTNKTLSVGPEVKNFAQIKQGDKVVVEQVESVAVIVTPPGEVAPAAGETSYLQTAKPGEKPHAVAVRTRQITATVEAIDYNARTVTVQGPEGNTMTLAVGPGAKRFNQVKQGDQVTVRYTEATAISVRKS